MTLGANVYVLDAAEGISEDPAAGTVTLAAPANAYAVGDYVIGDGTSARFAKKITSVTTVGTDLVLGVVDATLQEFIASGTISADVTPDWAAGPAPKLRSPSAKSLGQEDVGPDGGITLDNVSLFDLAITTDGTINWASSTVMGEPVASDSGVIKMADVSSCAGGYLRATVTQGTLRVVPTTNFDYEIAAGELSAWGTMDVHVLYSIAVQVEASGVCQLELERTMLPTLSFPVTLPTTPPVYFDVELEVPAGFKLSANANGTALMEYHSEYAIAVDMSYTTAGGFSASKQWDKLWDQQNVDWGVNGFIVGELYLEPTVKVMLYGVGGPFIYLHPYIRAELYYPWQNDQDELFVGIGGGVGLELRMFLWNVSVKSDNLFDIYYSWDLMGPGGGSDLNLAPTANAQSVVVPTTGTEITLTGFDPDGDLLSFVIESPPSNGSLGLLNKSTGGVIYTPHAGYLGADSFTFNVHDGKAESLPATVNITVMSGTPPEARFSWTSDLLTVNVDASGSSDAEDITANLQARWDWNSDGIWDTGWSTTKTGTHTYTTRGTYVITLQVKDTDGMTSIARRTASFAPGSLVWAKRAGGGSNEGGYGVAILSDDSAVVTGYFGSTATFGPGEANETSLTSAGSYDIFIARYNPDGSLAWAKRAGGADTEWGGYAVAVLSDDSAVVTGSFQGTATFGAGELNQTMLTTAGNDDIFIARYNPDGTLAWATRAGSTWSDESGYGIAVLSDDSAVITGCFLGTAIFGPGEPNETTLTAAGSPGYLEVFVARYNVDGSLAWAKRAGGASHERAYDIAAFSDDSAVVTGYFQGTATFGPGEPNQTSMMSSGSADIFIARYNLDGSLSWAKRAGGPVEYDCGYGVAVLSDGSSVVTGRFEGTATFGPGEAGETSLTSLGGYNIFIARYRPDGTLAWAKRAGSDNLGAGSAVAVLSDDSAVVVGRASAGMARYNPDGKLAWVKSPWGWADAEDVAVLSDDSPVVVGNFLGTMTFSPGEANETSLTSAGLDDIFIARYNP